MDSDGCLLTNDHSSLDPERNEWANPTTKSGEETISLDMRQIVGFGLTFAASDIRSIFDAKPTKGLEYCDEG